MIKVYPGWEFSRICFDMEEVATDVNAKIGSNGMINSTCFVDLTLDEAKLVLEDLKKAIELYEYTDKICEADVEGVFPSDL